MATHPFRLVEDKTAYVLHRPIRRKGSEQRGAGVFQHKQYALAVIETDDIFPPHETIGSGLAILLYHSDFQADDKDGLLAEYSGTDTANSSRLFPVLRFNRALNSQSQPFRLLVRGTS